MDDAPQPSPPRVSAKSQLLGLATLALVALAVAFFWRRAAGAPDTTRVDAACVAARPRFAAFHRCLLGAPLRGAEKPAARLRNVILANETLAADVGWPRRCAARAQAVLDEITPVRAEDARVDRLVAALWSSRIALSRGRAPTGIDALWDAAKRLSITGAAPPASVVSARAPLRPLTAAEVVAAVLAPRLERVLAVDRGRLLLAGRTLRFCRVDAARIACTDGPATSPAVGYTLVESAATNASVRPADLVLVDASEGPDRIFDAASWRELGARERTYGAYSQRGGALVVRASDQPGSPRGSSILVESLTGAAASVAELRVPFSLVLPPRVEAGFVYYAYADLRPRAAQAGVADARTSNVGVDWLADDALAPRPASEHVVLPMLPVQVLGCGRDTGRSLAFVTAVPTDADEELPRTVEVHFYDAHGACTAVVRGELAGTAASVDCVGESAAFVARKQVLAQGHRSIRLSGLRCTVAGCEGTNATLSPMNDVPDAVTLGDGRVLVVYRTAASGGLRARIAPLAQLSTAREYVLSDEAAYGGIESAHRWLVRDGAGALLVLTTRAGVVALRVAADGTVALLRP